MDDVAPTPAAPTAAPATSTPPVPLTINSFLTGLLSILLADTSGVAVQNLQAFKTAVDAAPSVEGAVAAGLQLASNLQTSLPQVEGKVIQDVTDYVVTDAVTTITKAASTIAKAS